jgi:hypothetical protein
MRTLGTRVQISNSRLGCLSLFAVPLTAIGTFLAFLILRTLVMVAMMQGWAIVPATLRTVELSDSGSSSNLVVASYDYIFQGQQYSGHRVSLYGADNLGSFHEDTYRELHEYLARNEPYPVHVNPKAPAESILKPVLRLEVIGFYLVFAILFGGVGWGLTLASCSKFIKVRKEARLIEQYPGEPWKHRVEWIGSRIKSTQGIDAVMETSLAVFWNVATFPIFLIVPREMSNGRRGALAFLVVPLIGVGLAYWALAAIARAKRFGMTYLQLETMPGRPGEPFRGSIHAPRALEQASTVALTLKCEQDFAGPSSGGQSRIAIRELWRWDSTTPIARGQSPDGGVILAVDIAIPAGLPDSRRGQSDQVRWLLSAVADVPGAGFSIEMEVPVFNR